MKTHPQDLSQKGLELMNELFCCKLLPEASNNEDNGDESDVDQNDDEDEDQDEDTKDEPSDDDDDDTESMEE